MLEPRRAVDVFLRYLLAEGVDRIFGVPGGLVYPLLAQVEDEGRLTFVAAKHEEGAAFMADGYARTSGKIGVCAGTSGPGATNLVTGVSCAFADGVPLLVITGNAASTALGRGAAQETPREGIDVVAMFKPITKYSAMVTSADSLSRHLRRALRAAMTGRRGPVHLNVPVDVWERPLTEVWFDPRTYRAETRSFDRASVQRAGDLLVEAEYPVILAGSGVIAAGAQAELEALANLLPARVATTPRAKGAFPEDDPYSLGVHGTGGHRAARETLHGREVDVLFTVGASLSETSTHNWDPRLAPSRALLQVDVDPDKIGRNYPVDVGLVGDARAVLLEIAYHVQRRTRAGTFPRSRWEKAPPIVRGNARFDGAEQRISDACPVTPQRWRADLEKVLPSDAIVFSDIGGHMLFNIHHLTIKRGQSFVINLGFGSMGHGTAAPIGAAMANPGRPVIAIVGDACFTMNGMELLTAVEHNARVVWIVENNNMQGITWHCSKLLNQGKGMRAARYKRELDVAALATAMGVHARVVTRPGEVEDAVREALALGGPAVVDVRVDGSVPPPLGERAKTLAAFIDK